VDVTFYVFGGVPTVFGFGRDFLAASPYRSSVYVAEATSGKCGQKRSMCGHSPSTAGAFRAESKTPVGRFYTLSNSTRSLGISGTDA
jgi:hypothetical protein